MNANVGLLRIIDGIYIKLPNNAANWTAISKDSCGIKLHVRIVVASPDSVFPEKMIPSTGNAADSDAVNHIIDADGALYNVKVMVLFPIHQLPTPSLLQTLL